MNFVVAIWITVLLFAVIWGGALPLGWIGLSELFLRRRLRREGRFLPWIQVVQALEKGEGEFEFRYTGHSGRFVFWPQTCDVPPGYFTDCPRRFWNPKRLAEHFPNAKISVTHHAF